MTMISRGQEVLVCQPFAHVVALEGRETVCDGCMRMASEVLRSFFGCGVLGYLFKASLENFCPPKHKKVPSKVAHNPTRPRVFSPASFCFVQLRQFFSLFFFLIFEVVKLCRMNLESPDSI